MKAIGSVISAPLKLIGLVPKTPKLPAPTPAPTRDDAVQAAQAEDALSRRRGGLADIITGSGGAEPAAPTGKATLGS